MYLLYFGIPSCFHLGTVSTKYINEPIKYISSHLCFGWLKKEYNIQTMKVFTCIHEISICVICHFSPVPVEGLIFSSMSFPFTHLIEKHIIMLVKLKEYNYLYSVTFKFVFFHYWTKFQSK